MNRLSVCLLFSSVVFAQQSPSASQVAGLEQDVAQVRMDVARLSEQIADLQNAVRALRANPAPASGNASADRQTILAEVDKKTNALRTELDAAFATFTKQVNAALANRTNSTAVVPVSTPSAGQPVTTAAEPAAQPAAARPTDSLPADMPRTGIRYKVKAGESLSGIARRNGSKVEWILKANQMDNPNQVKADSEIFIPQP
jgi:LysM repeat protein